MGNRKPLPHGCYPPEKFDPFRGGVNFPFSALTLLVGDRKGIRPVKNWVLVCWWWHLIGGLHVL